MVKKILLLLKTINIIKLKLLFENAILWNSRSDKKKLLNRL